MQNRRLHKMVEKNFGTLCPRSGQLAMSNEEFRRESVLLRKMLVVEGAARLWFITAGLVLLGDNPCYCERY
jgi:hypothetical protein